MRPELKESEALVLKASDEDMILEQQMHDEAVAAWAVEEKMEQVVVEPFDVSHVIVNKHCVDCSEQFVLFEGGLQFSHLSTWRSKLKLLKACQLCRTRNLKLLRRQ